MELAGDWCSWSHGLWEEAGELRDNPRRHEENKRYAKSPWMINPTQGMPLPETYCCEKKQNSRWVAIGDHLQCCILARSKSSRATENIPGCSSVSEVKQVKGTRGDVPQWIQYTSLRSTLDLMVEIWVNIDDKSCDMSHELHSRPLLFF